MTRQIKALLLSCAIHALLVLAIIGAVRTGSVPLRIDLMDFTLLDASGLEMSAPALPGPGKVSQDTRSVGSVKDSRPPIIVHRPQKVKIQAPRLEAVSDASPPAEPALEESIIEEERAAVEAESATATAVPKPGASSAALTGPAPSEPANLAAIAPAASRGSVTGQHSQTSQEQYLVNHFAGIRGRILRNLSYPAIARKKGWEGQVRLSFRIDHEGGVEAITVLASSGYEMLDRRAMDVVRQVAPFPQPLENAEITMPITFSLTQ